MVGATGGKGAVFIFIVLIINSRLKCPVEPKIIAARKTNFALQILSWTLVLGMVQRPDRQLGRLDCRISCYTLGRTWRSMSVC